MAKNTEHPALAEKFSKVAEALASSEEAILKELADAQGQPVDIGGYYNPDEARTSAAMRPSDTLNRIIATI